LAAGACNGFNAMGTADIGVDAESDRGANIAVGPKAC
jgi:hypothetical protein